MYIGSCDGNLYDNRGDSCSFRIDCPEPGCYQNLQSWREFFHLDEHSSQAKIEADFDVETGRLEISVEGNMPECRRVKEYRDKLFAEEKVK